MIVSSVNECATEDGAAPAGSVPTPDLAVVVPTYNERGNVLELTMRLEAVLSGIRWEVLFVDDDSPDGTASVIAGLASRDSRIRLIHRIGRRGLSSACIEGILATTAPYVAIMDADLQHDESILPQMLSSLRIDSLDIVVGTRNAQGGSMGEFGKRRVMLSRLGQQIGHKICRCDISDPMSGFFVFKRSYFLEVARRLHGRGFKILVDMLSSAQRPVCLGEVGYTFRTRCHGKSKLDVNTGIEYLFLIIDKLIGGIIPVRFVAFSLVGAIGLGAHLLCLSLLLFDLHWCFLSAQITATYIAMTANFFLNNLITWRDRSLRGVRLIFGLVTFCVACSFGAWANAIFARALFQTGIRWYLAGIAGIVISSVWNYSMSNLFTWQKKQFLQSDIGMVENCEAADSEARYSTTL
jgi:dolichol-phosphate mannosyltransferase